MRILVIIRKEIIHLLRDLRMLYFALFWPVVLLIIFGFTVNFDIKNVPLAIIDLDQTSVSREFVHKLKATNKFDIKYYQSFTWQMVNDWLEKGAVKEVIILPNDFSQRLDRSEEIPFLILVDGSDNNTASISLGYLLGTTQSYYQAQLMQELNRRGINLDTPINYSIRFLYNPSLRSQNFIVPGLMAVIMMIIGTLLTSMTIAGEWDKGTMEQLFYTPVKSFELVLGKLATYFGLGIIQITLVLLTSIFIFSVPFRGSLFLFYFASFLFLIGALGVGLFISLIAKTQQVAAMLAFLTSMLPAILLSGFIFPISSMPVVLQILSYLVPAKYFLNIIRGIFLKGTGINILWNHFLALVIYAGLFFFISVRRFKKRLD